MAEYIDKWSVVNRLIDIENEFQRHKPFHGFEHDMYRKICETEIAIGKTPAADVEPVKHGMWIAKQTALGTKYTVCSNCGYGISIPLDGHLSKLDLYDVPRCPNCGARMDLEATDEA